MNASVLSTTQDIVQQAGEVLLDYFRRRSLETAFKDDRTVVTEADLAADRLITQALRSAFPEDGLLSEEQAPPAGAVPPRLWVLDPLDGTTNFRLGLPIWGISLARLSAGEPDLGVVYFPVLDELYLAQRGAGARLNGQPIHVLPAGIAGRTAFFTCCSRTHRRYRVNLPYKTRILGSAAYNLLAVARGSAVLAFEATSKVWDFAAAWLMVQEAGGVIAPLHGPAPFPMTTIATTARSYPILAAASAALARQGQQHIQPRTLPPAG